MTGNSNFPTPNPPLATLESIRSGVIAKTNEIEQAEDGLRMKFTERLTGVQMLKDALRQEAAYVQNTSGGDAAKILSAGMDVFGPKAPVGPLEAPQNVQALFADNEGEVAAKWDAVLGAQSYIVECSQDPNGPWTQAAITTRSSHTLTGLTSGKKYWIRVRGVGAAGLGPWSDPAVKMAA
jgi:hypothetical protein